MRCGEEMHGHHAGHGFHHNYIMHGMHSCCCGEELHGLHGFHHSSTMHSCCYGGRRFQSRKKKIEILEEYRDSLLNELEGVEEELRALKNE